MNQPNFSGKHIRLLGFGIEGQSTVEYLLRHGATVSVYDEAQISTSFTEPLEKQGVLFFFSAPPSLDGVDILIRTPGAKPTHPYIETARGAKITVTTATNIFFENCPAPIIGVTGTKGKGTTSTLIYEILKTAKKKTFLGGNIGVPMLSFLDDVTPESIVVLELSSFQLFDSTRSPHVAVILMVTSEHLDYHRDIEEYVSAKANITKNQAPTDFVIVNQDYENSAHIASNSRAQKMFVSIEHPIHGDGAFIENETVVLRKNSQTISVLPVSEVMLVGRHNLENVTAAVAATSSVDIPTESMRTAIATFKGLPHRLEYIATVNEADYYNDSIATTPESTIAALRAFTNPIVVILGGSGKNSDFSLLGEALKKQPPVAIIGVGAEWPRIKASLPDLPQTKIIEGLSSMSDIVTAAHSVVPKKGIVLLSPACASFDQYKNYAERGKVFRDAVLHLT